VVTKLEQEMNIPAVKPQCGGPNYVLIPAIAK
jgi:hypothetical protein